LIGADAGVRLTGPSIQNLFADIIIIMT